MAGTVLPRALDGITLGPRVLELGPGYGASTRPLATRAPSPTPAAGTAGPGKLPARLARWNTVRWEIRA